MQNIAIILTIIFAAFLIFGIAHIIYVQYHRGEAVEYLVEKYNTSAQDYKIKKYYPRKLVNNSSHSSNLFEFYFTMSEPSGGSGGEGAPMVYADNVKDWNNLILTKAYLDLLNEDPEDVRHVFPH